MLKTICCCVLAGVLFLAGCGKEERTEATRLSHTLAQKQADFAAADSMEKDFVASARAWCGGITANGAGRGAELEQNATVATELAKSAVAISLRLSQVRQAVYDETLRHEYPQSIRTGLITEITRRQRMLQDMRALLDQSAPEFLAYRQSKTYAGDQYPGGIGKLDALLQAYRAPDDAVGSDLAALKAKYNL